MFFGPMMRDRPKGILTPPAGCGKQRQEKHTPLRDARGGAFRNPNIPFPFLYQGKTSVFQRFFNERIGFFNAFSACLPMAFVVSFHCPKRRTSSNKSLASFSVWDEKQSGE
jgi:hypothetical protein